MRLSRPVIRKTLVVLTALLWLAFGTWRLYLAYGASFFEIAPLVVGKPIKVRGRFLQYGPNPSIPVSVFVRDGNSGSRVRRITTMAQSTGWGTYEFSTDLPPIQEAGRYDFIVVHGKGQKGPPRLFDQKVTIKSAGGPKS